jgi:GT2 family glycosyltransferase
LRRTVGELIRIGLADVPVLVLDDASDDPAATEAALAGLNQCKMMRNKERTGQAEGRNRLIRAAETPYCICLDDDTFFTDLGRLAEIVSQPVAEDKVGGYVFHTVREYDGFREFPENMPAMPVPKFIGCAVMFQRDAYLSVGGYRGFFRYGCEEPDLAVRLWRVGYRMMFEPSVKILHFHTQAARDHNEYHFLYARNAILSHFLNYPGIYGLPLGVARSVKRALVFRHYWRSVVPGIFAGIRDSLLHRKERTVLSYRQYAAWRRFGAENEEVIRRS